MPSAPKPSRETIDFSHKMTDVLFDRTPEQRRQHTELMLEARKAGNVTDASAHANAIMFRELVLQIESETADRVRVLESDAELMGLSAALPQLDIVDAAQRDVRAVYASLHEAWPVYVGGEEFSISGLPYQGQGAA